METVRTLAQDVITRAGARKLRLVTAESCTGGQLSALFTDIPGAGEVFFGGIVCYSKSCKQHILGVSPELIQKETAVSQAVAEAMARGALEKSDCDIASAITGVAGPVPDEDGNPVGLLHVAVASRFGELHHCCRHLSEQPTHRIRATAIRIALKLILETLERVPRVNATMTR